MPEVGLAIARNHIIVLSKLVRKTGNPVEAKVYPAFGSGPRDGHSFCVRGTAIWGPDVLRFVETYLK